jgi:predicted small lipoprotein YifL
VRHGALRALTVLAAIHCLAACGGTGPPTLSPTATEMALGPTVEPTPTPTPANTTAPTEGAVEPTPTATPIPPSPTATEPEPAPVEAAATAEETGAKQPPDAFDLEKLLIDVFAPLPGEVVLIMADLPHDGLRDHGEWAARREMAGEWHEAFEDLGGRIGFSVHPLLTYPATGAHNGPLPLRGEMGDEKVRFEDVMASSNIVVALTEYSATASLAGYAATSPDLRAASMPMVSKRMESSALAADYGEVAAKSHTLVARLDRATSAEVEFSTGDKMHFDLRYRRAEADDGQLHAGKEGARIINLPSGEAYMAPYEGEREGEPSRTEGTIPLMLHGEQVRVTVRENRIVDVLGDGLGSKDVREWLDVDQARRNIAELGLGCNDRAVVTGNVLEDEKVMGMHWAAGLSEHLGGVVGVDDFSDPSHAVHHDVVYPAGGPIEVTSLVLTYEDGTHEEIMRDGQYTIF